MTPITQRERLTLLGSALGCTEVAPEVLTPDVPVQQEATMKIRTSYDFPPIPIRSMDWSAIDDNTYCGCGECRCPVGRGATEQEAVADLLEQLGESDETADDTRYEQFAGQQPWKAE